MPYSKVTSTYTMAGVRTLVACHHHTTLVLMCTFMYPFTSPPPPSTHPHTYDFTQFGTALHLAVKKEHEDIVELLLEAHIDPDLPDKVSHVMWTVYLITVFLKRKFGQLVGHVYALDRKNMLLNCLSLVPLLLVVLY